MRPVDEHPALQRMVRTLRIVVFALAAGVIVFLGLVAWDHFVGGEAESKPGRGLLTWMSIGLAVVVVMTFAFVRMGMIRAARDAFARKDVPGFVGRYQAATIVWCAGLEGAAFFAAVAFLLEGHVLSLAVGAFLALCILGSVPSRGRVDTLLEAVP